MPKSLLAVLLTLILLPLAGWLVDVFASAETSLALLNVSYDPTRELWQELNVAFTDQWQAAHGQAVKIRQSHGGSSSQARAVRDGLPADVVSLALWTDTDAIRQAGLMETGWEERLPGRSLPFFSTVVFVVRKGNPRGIRDWPDLLKDDVQVITPNPRTSGNGKLGFLAAWGFIKHAGGSDQAASEFVTSLYRRVPVLDSGARGATMTFAQRGIGDVHLTWESEAFLELRESGGALELVYPSVSIRAEPHVSLVDATVDRRGTRLVAEAYLRYLYTPAGQRIIAKHGFRPALPGLVPDNADRFTPLKLLGIADIAGSWEAAQQRFFSEGGVFDAIYRPGS